MDRKEIKAIFNDNELNKMNSNFKELYDEFGNVVDTVTEKAFDKVVDSAKINWGEPVDTFDNLPSNASNSETRMTRDDGKIYRFDGSIWREIQDIDPTAINEVDSRLSSQLAEKATKDELVVTNQNVVDLEANKMDKNTTDISFGQINKNLVKLDQTYMTDEFLQQMAGNAPINSTPAIKSVTTDKLAGKAVTPGVTSFVKLGKNKFDGTYYNGVVLGGTSTASFSKRSTGKVAILKVEPHKNYTVSRSSDTDRFRVFGNVGFPQDGVQLNYAFVIDDVLGKATIYTEDADHLLVYVSSETENKVPAFLQAELGEVATTYSPPKAIFAAEIGFLAGHPSAFGISLANEKITTKLAGSMVISRSERLILKDGVWDFSSYIQYQTIIVCMDRSTGDIVFLNHNELENGAGEYLIILGAIRRDAGSYYISGLHTVEGSENSGKQPSGGAKKDFFIADMYNGTFYSDEPVAMLERGDSFSLKLYGIFDALVSEFPEYVTRTLLGTEGSGRSIYRYDFNPPTNHSQGDFLYSHPTVYVQSMIHGHEWASGVSVANFFDDICRKWKDNEALRMFRWNIHFVVVPVLNPYGTDYVTRTNYNGVDLNRNFPVDWVFNPDTGSINYSGTEPLSEIESQIVRDLFANNDFMFALDSHNFGSYLQDSNHYTLWMGSTSDEMNKLLSSVGNLTSSIIKEQFSVGNNSETLTRVSYLNTPGDAVRYFESQSVPSALFELPYGIEHVDIVDSEKFAQKCNKEALGNLLLSVIREYQYIK